MNVFTQDTQLTATNIKALRGTNITVVAAPPAGLAVFPVGIHIFLKHGGTDFVQTNDTDQLAILYKASTEISEVGSQAQFKTLIEASADASLYCPLSLVVTQGGGLVPVAATALDLDNNAGAEWTTGNGTLSVRVWYIVLPMTAFV